VTARTSQLCADALRCAGFEDLAKRAEADEFHDFLSPHATPELILVHELTAKMMAAKDNREHIAAANLRQRVINGDFDADLKESDDWAASPEGQAAFEQLMKGK
jgi:hypothetical protein